MKKYVIFMCLLAFFYAFNAQSKTKEKIFGFYSNGRISSQYKYRESLVKNARTIKTVLKSESHIVCNSASSFTRKTYKDVCGKVSLTDGCYVYSNMPGDVYTVKEIQYRGMTKAILCHEHAGDLVLAIDGRGDGLTSVSTKYFGFNSCDDLLNYYSHYEPNFGSPGVIYLDGCRLATFDVIEEVKADKNFTIKTYKCTGDGWDNEFEDFNVLEIYNDSNGKCIASTCGVFNNFATTCSNCDFGTPFYQIDLKTCTAILLTGKEDSGMTPYFTIIVIKNGNAEVVYRKQRSCFSLYEDENFVTLELFKVGSRQKSATIEFDKSSDDVFLYEY